MHGGVVMDTREIMYKWYDYAEACDDVYMRFMAYWMIFNMLYGALRKLTPDERNPHKRKPSSERAQIHEFCKTNRKYLKNARAFWNPAINIYLETPVEDVRPGLREDSYGWAKRNLADLAKKSDLALLMTIYQVRCNLVHGLKRPDSPRDEMLVDSGGRLLKNYLDVLPVFRQRRVDKADATGM